MSKIKNSEGKEITNPITIEVRRADGIKCQRCWNYHTVQGNPKDVCDRCVVVITEMLPYLEEQKIWTKDECEWWRIEVQKMKDKWKSHRRE